MNTKLDKILAEISAGELVDKITILEIKKNKITDENNIIIYILILYLQSPQITRKKHHNLFAKLQEISKQILFL